MRIKDRNFCQKICPLFLRDAKTRHDSRQALQGSPSRMLMGHARKILYNFITVFFCSCSNNSNIPEQSPINVLSPQYQYNQQQNYYPRPQTIPYNYTPVNVPNFQYYTNPYNNYSNPWTRTYQDYDQYYRPPTDYDGNEYNPYKESKEKARERSAGVANQMYNN